MNAEKFTQKSLEAIKTAQDMALEMFAAGNAAIEARF